MGHCAICDGDFELGESHDCLPADAWFGERFSEMKREKILSMEYKKQGYLGIFIFCFILGLILGSIAALVGTVRHPTMSTGLNFLYDVKPLERFKYSSSYYFRTEISQ